MSDKPAPRRNPVQESIDMLRDLSPQRQKQYAAALTVLSTLSDEDQDAVLDYINSHQMRITPYSVSNALIEIRASTIALTESGNPDPSQHFTFEGSHDVRVIDRNSDLWFVAADACAAVEVGNVTDALSRLDDDEKDEIDLIDSIGRMQKMRIISESGLYSLILTSRKPAAKRFKRWITHDVIPAIRKTGSYSTSQSLTPAEQLLVSAQRLVDHERALAEHEQRIADLEYRQTAIEQGSSYFTILAFARRHNRRVTNHQSRVLGMTAARLSREWGYDIGRASDPRYGTVNTYHEDILDAVFGIQPAPRELPSGK